MNGSLYTHDELKRALGGTVLRRAIRNRPVIQRADWFGTEGMGTLHEDDIIIVCEIYAGSNNRKVITRYGVGFLSKYDMVKL